MEIIRDKKTAILFGASGLVGGFCLEQLLTHPSYEKVISVGRRKVPERHPKLEQVIIDFEKMEDYLNEVKGNDVFICLGTTRAKAGKKGFVKVDFTYSFNAAKMAAMNGANQLMLVSSVGADKDSYFLYPRIKGKLEFAVKKLPFWSVHIFQPSFLLGDRYESRWGEEIASRLGAVIDRVTGGLLKKYSPVEAEIVAKAMVKAAQQIKGGIHVYPSNEIEAMGQDTLLFELEQRVETN